KQGFFKVFSGTDPYDESRALAGWGNWELLAPGASYKLYPCCYSTHYAVEATRNLVRRHGPFDPRAVARVDSQTSEFGLAHTNRPAPDGPLDAKFSVQYCVARARVEGRAVLEHFEGNAYLDPVVQDLPKRVHASPYSGKPFAAADPFDAEVKITLTDGRTFSEKVDRPLGRTADNPITYEDMKAKFENCASRVLAPDAVARACRAIESLETLGSIRELTALLVPAAA